KFNALLLNLMTNPGSAGINFETVEGASDRRVKSLRVDQNYRVIAYVDDGAALLAHVDAHDQAYAWARRRKVVFNKRANGVEIVEVAERSVGPAEYRSPTRGLFAEVSDADFERLGIVAERLPLIRRIESEADLDAVKDDVTSLVYETLICLAAGYRA